MRAQWVLGCLMGEGPFATSPLISTVREADRSRPETRDLRAGPPTLVVQPGMTFRPKKRRPRLNVGAGKEGIAC